VRKLIGPLALAVVAAAVISAALSAHDVRPPSQVTNWAGEPGPLAAKLERAAAQASSSSAGQAFWIGYSIERLQGEHSTIGSFHDGDGALRPTIADILAGRSSRALSETTAEDVGRAAADALEKIERQGKPEKKVIKELGFFLRYEPGRRAALSRVRMSNLDLSFDFEGAPLYWLGRAPEDQSLGLIRELYGRGGVERLRQDLIAAAGCHGAPRLVLPFLAGILAGSDPDELRKDAAFWISQQDDPEGLRLLSKAARTDRSREVREGAVFGLSQIEVPAAVDEMIALTREAEQRDVRKQAVFWLGQMASKKAAGVLEETALKDGDMEIQEQALFALAELPDHQGVEALIKMARTHPDPRLRKKAVFWLGESDDPKALDAIIAILKGK